MPHKHAIVTLCPAFAQSVNSTDTLSRPRPPTSRAYADIYAESGPTHFDDFRNVDSPLDCVFCDYLQTTAQRVVHRTSGMRSGRGRLRSHPRHMLFPGPQFNASHFICQSVGCNIIVVDSERHENDRQSGDSH